MSFLTSVIVLIAATLIQIFLQLVPGTFTLFYHYTIGKKSRSKATDFALYFILGHEIFLATIFLILCIIISLVNQYLTITLDYLVWIFCGIFLAEAIASAFFYYRRGKTTRLFISRKISTTIQSHAEKTKTNTDAFALGFLSGTPELIFTLPLYIVVVFTLMQTNLLHRGFLAILFILCSAIPLLAIYATYHTDHHLVQIQRLRLRAKPFVKIVLCLSFVSLSFILILGAINYG